MARSIAKIVEKVRSERRPRGSALMLEPGPGETRLGGEGALLHGGLQGMPPKQRARVERERARRHNREVDEGREGNAGKWV